MRKSVLDGSKISIVLTNKNKNDNLRSSDASQQISNHYNMNKDDKLIL